MIASASILDADGDCRRIVECNDLVINDASSDRAISHPVEGPHAFGYIELANATALRGTGLQALHLQVDEAAAREGKLRGTIHYGRNLLPRPQENDEISYRYDWWAVNSFAMDQRQFRFMYGDDRSFLEFTHFPVNDPTDILTVVVRFPDTFRLVDRPGIFVGKPQGDQPGEWIRQSSIEMELDMAKALVFHQSLNTAALRVHQPQQGYSYGIQWRVPTASDRARGAKSGQIEEIVTHLLAVRERTTSDQRRDLAVVLDSVTALLGEELIPDWEGTLEVSLMLFDSQRSKMVVVCAADVESERDYSKWLDKSHVELNYGEGIAGKAFKTNAYRLYVRIPPGERKAPDYYRELSGGPRHAVLLSMPLQNPDDKEYVYAVLNFGSPSSSCPLRELGESAGSATPDMMRDLQATLNNVCFELLTNVLPLRSWTKP